jgi:uncharacterized membrane protein HdeD (DUF308 family)
MAHTDLQQPASPLSALAWGVLVIGGIFAIIIGLVAIIWPSVTFTVLVVLLGVYAFISGLFTVLLGAVWPPGWGLRGLMVLEGVLGIVVGVLIFLRPESAAIALIYLIAAWAIITGILQIVQALRLRRVIDGEWALIVGGLASVIFGVLLAIWPKESLIALVWIFGVFAVVFGVMQLVLAYRVRRMDVA